MKKCTYKKQEEENLEDDQKKDVGTTSPNEAITYCINSNIMTYEKRYTHVYCTSGLPPANGAKPANDEST